MNKLMTVLGVAAVATLAGCKDPTYQRIPLHGDEARNAEPVEVTPPPPAVVIEKGCLCAPGTVHKEPCKCGASDCKCVVVKDVPPPPPPVKVVDKPADKPATPPLAIVAPAPEYTEYVVQHGDYLAKISKRTNVSIAAIKKANSLTSDKVRVGQKLKIPGKIDASVLPAPTVAAKPGAAAKSVTPYSGATKEYVVKNGDTLGAIAYGNGINIRQLKELNGLTGDSLRVGQKLKIPAEKVQAAPATVVKAPAAPKAEVKKPEAKKPEVKKVEPVVAPKVEDPAVPADQEKSEEKVVEPVVADNADSAAVPVATPAPAAAESYVVKEGDDMTSVSITYGVSAAAIRELNNLPDDAQLTPGQVIKLPAEAQQ